MEFAALYDVITAASYAEDVFGDDVKTEEDCRKKYHGMAKTLHPDVHENYPKEVVDKANEASRLLNAFWSTARKAFKIGVYGKRVKMEEPNGDPALARFASKRYQYALIKRIASGGTCGVFDALLTTREGNTIECVVKIPHSPDDNDLMRREADALSAIARNTNHIPDEPGSRWVRQRLPIVLETLSLSSPGSAKAKLVNVFPKAAGHTQGWFTLTQIRQKHIGGVNSRVAAFIFNRMLEALTISHASGIVHGLVRPNHVLIHADSHAGQLIDWTASCRMDKTSKLPYTDAWALPYIPEDDRSTGRVSKGGDIYGAAACAAYLLGASPGVHLSVRGDVEDDIIAFFNRCLQPKRRNRYNDVEQAYTDFDRLCKRVFGPRKFVPLVMN